MPRVLELKEIDGALWAKLEITLNSPPVSLYTAAEIEELQKSERVFCIGLIRDTI